MQMGVDLSHQQVSACLGRFRAREQVSVESANPLSKMGLVPGSRFGQLPLDRGCDHCTRAVSSFPHCQQLLSPCSAASDFAASLASPMLALPFLLPPFLGPLSQFFSLCPISCLSPPLTFCSLSPVTPFSLPPSGTGQPSCPVSWAQGQRPQHVGLVGS